MRPLALSTLLLTTTTALACEQFRWSTGEPGPQDDINHGMVVVPDGFEGESCFDSSTTEFRDSLKLWLSNMLDADYIVRVEDGAATLFEDLVPANTQHREAIVPIHNAGLGAYRVTMTVTHPTQEAYLTAQVSEGDAATEQFMFVSAYKTEDAGTLSPLESAERYVDTPFERPEYPSETER